MLCVGRRQRHHRDRARENAGRARPRRPHSEQRHAVPARRLSAGADIPSRRDARVSAVSRAAIPAVARQQDRAGGEARATGYRPRPLRHPARDRGVPGAADSGGDPARPRARGHHDAARHRHHAARERSFVFGNGGVLHRAVRRRHRRVEEPEGRHLPRARAEDRHPRHPEFSQLRRAPPRRGVGGPRAADWRRTGKGR